MDWNFLGHLLLGILRHEFWFLTFDFANFMFKLLMLGPVQKQNISRQVELIQMTILIPAELGEKCSFQPKLQNT